MGDFYFTLLLPLIFAFSSFFLIYRLRFFAADKIAGRTAFLTGSSLVTVALFWQALKSHPQYYEWFLDDVYDYINYTEYSLLFLGLLFLVSGLSLYSDYWEMYQVDLESQEEKLSILRNLQTIARQPYHFLEVLNLSIKEIVNSIPEASGALFLINQKRGELVMTSSLGLSKDEISKLERLPLSRNIVGHTIEAGEPVIGGNFSFSSEASSGKPISLKYNSTLLLPLISGSDKMGIIILFSLNDSHFGREEIKYLSVAADWVAEKIKSARLARENVQSKKIIEKLKLKNLSFNDKIISLLNCDDPVSSSDKFCKSLLGSCQSESVFLIGTLNGSLHFFGGSEKLWKLSENYKTALLEAIIEKNRPLIINQDTTNEDGETITVESSLIIPFSNSPTAKAILLRRDSQPFDVSTDDLAEIKLFTGIASLLIELESARKLSLSRKKGFEQIMELMNFKKLRLYHDEPSFVAKQISSFLPDNSLVMAFSNFSEEESELAYMNQLSPGKNIEIVLDPTKLPLKEMTLRKKPIFFGGKTAVKKAIESLESDSRQKLQSLFGEKNVPAFMSLSPIISKDKIDGFLMIFIYDIVESEYLEWERLITLAGGMYSLNLGLYALLEEKEMTPEGPDNSLVINQINNYLSSVIGIAELKSNETDIPRDYKDAFNKIVDEATLAAGFVRKKLGQKAVKKEIDSKYLTDNLFDKVIERSLSSSHISENLYMINGKPREMQTRLNSNSVSFLSSDNIMNMFSKALDSFSELAEEDDLISVSTYTEKGYIFLDISRHRKNFPPVEKVSGFGKYNEATEVLKTRPADDFLKIIGSESLYSYDQYSQRPTYLSFKFPISKSEVKNVNLMKKLRILAIDDQPVILDLLSAMCQSAGYDIDTAESGNEGIEKIALTEYDIVLTDLSMPGISGLDTARKIKEIRPDTPIILLTGWEATIEKFELNSAGISDVLYKPFRIEQLTEMISSAVKSSKIS